MSIRCAHIYQPKREFLLAMIRMKQNVAFRSRCTAVVDVWPALMTPLKRHSLPFNITRNTRSSYTKFLRNERNYYCLNVQTNTNTKKHDFKDEPRDTNSIDDVDWWIAGARRCEVPWWGCDAIDGANFDSTDIEPESIKKQQHTYVLPI